MESLKELFSAYRNWGNKGRFLSGEHAEHLINIIKTKGIPELGEVADHDNWCRCEFHINDDELSYVKDVLCIHEWDIYGVCPFLPVPGLPSERIIAYMADDKSYWECMHNSEAFELHINAYWSKEEAEKILSYIKNRKSLEEIEEDDKSYPPYCW